ncbi:MAG: prepilin-type N-terminal cleavage/methylation domain-containing protein [Phycisphaerales bacterium]
MRNRVSKAFTLVEILIVVVILGILAAIVVPQFTNATQDAQGGNILTQMDTVQNQLELYKARNPAVGYPTVAALSVDSTNPLHAGKGWGLLIDNGYLKSPPANPVNGSTTITPGLVGAATFGWHWDEATGTLGACYFDEANAVVTPNVP